MAMDSDSDASRIPLDLVYHVLKVLPLTDLLPVMFVSRFWRRAARSMPAFWRDIELTSSSDASLALFRSRLEERPADAISIGMFLALEPFNHLVIETVVPLLVLHVPRCTQLHIHVHIDADLAVLAALCYPTAQRLEMLTIAFYGEIDDYRDWRARRFSVPLPPALFASTAPQLRRIYIRAVDIRRTWPTAFASVTTATFDHGTIPKHSIHFDIIGTNLPALRDLTVIGNLGTYVGTIELLPVAQSLLARLDILRVLMSEGMPPGLLYCPWPGFALMRHIRTTDTSADALEVLMPHLGNHVSLDARRRAHPAKDEYDLRYLSFGTGICRSFIGVLVYSRQSTRPVLPGLDLVQFCLCRLELDAEVWPKLATCFVIPTLPACTDVVLKLSPRIMLADIMAMPIQLQCPALRAVVLSSSESDEVLRYTAAEVAHLITSLFARVESVVHVTLRAVDLHGELDGVSDWIQLVRS
ncbi:hypothetical protein EXIGLDRAFT_772490 [Exidia glandulosa HHB12029]|uniref:F-box domain-containing protein n=1 Tax=Exidia glandulosa HHB12029 TaxID=1314781 RepID=A0A165FA30_EXIGL|nr:hypothetical protein EXIGLDRAFT_772490 [Exidia glandulosa HHB12029]